MRTKQLIPPHELDAMRDWLAYHRDINGGLMDIYKQWKSSTGLGKYD